MPFLPVGSLVFGFFSLQFCHKLRKKHRFSSERSKPAPLRESTRRPTEHARCENAEDTTLPVVCKKSPPQPPLYAFSSLVPRQWQECKRSSPKRTQINDQVSACTDPHSLFLLSPEFTGRITHSAFAVAHVRSHYFSLLGSIRGVVCGSQLEEAGCR